MFSRPFYPINIKTVELTEPNIFEATYMTPAGMISGCSKLTHDECNDLDCSEK